MRQLLKLQSEIQHEQKLQDDQSMQQQQLPVLQRRNELIARSPSKAGEQWTQNSYRRPTGETEAKPLKGNRIWRNQSQMIEQQL